MVKLAGKLLSKRRIVMLPFRSSRRQTGFTLLEAIVSIVLLASVGVAVYALIGANMISMFRVKQVSTVVPIVYEAIVELQSMPIHQQGVGSFLIRDTQVSWKAIEIGKKRNSQNVSGYRGLYDIGLYDVQFELTRDGKFLASYSIRRAGYQKVRLHDGQ